MLWILLGIASLAGGPPEDLLAGPRVESRERPGGIAERTYAGGVRRLEESPEEAALRLMELSAAEREDADRVIAERAALLDRLVVESIELFPMLESAGESNDVVRLVPVAAELYRRAAPLRERGPMRDELRAAIPEGRRDEFDRLVDSYWAAIAAEAPAGRKFAAVVEERGRLLGKAVERSYARQERSGDIAVEYVLRGLSLAPEQERIIRGIIADRMGDRGLETMSEDEQGMLFLSVMAHLNLEQQKAMIRIVRGQ